MTDCFTQTERHSFTKLGYDKYHLLSNIAEKFSIDGGLWLRKSSVKAGIAHQ